MELTAPMIGVAFYAKARERRVSSIQGEARAGTSPGHYGWGFHFIPFCQDAVRTGQFWYEDPARKQIHRDLVLAGMERARRQGKRIGRPRVRERPDFEQRFSAVVERLQSGETSRSQGARELGIGYATLHRFLEDQHHG